jgi:hypothetical protein
LEDTLLSAVTEEYGNYAVGKFIPGGARIGIAGDQLRDGTKTHFEFLGAGRGRGILRR